MPAGAEPQGTMPVFQHGIDLLLRQVHDGIRQVAPGVVKANGTFRVGTVPKATFMVLEDPASGVRDAIQLCHLPVAPLEQNELSG